MPSAKVDDARHVRDYQTICRRLMRLRGWRVEQVATVWGYPFFQVTRVGHRRWPTIFLSGGMHGEEPAGVEAVLQWLERPAACRWAVNWYVLPCINPYGWERNYRRNRQRYDINRQFRGRTDCVEANLVKRLLRGRRFALSFEMHEDVDSPGYYLYEHAGTHPTLADRILRAVAPVTPINRNSVIDGRRADGRGLITRPATWAALRQRPQWPMAYHVLRRHADHLIGSETPTRAPLARRIAAHHRALTVAVRYLTDRPPQS